MKLFHATRRSNLADIMVEGLMGGSRDQFGVQQGEYPGDPVHLASYDTREFISDLFMAEPDEIVLLEVDVTGLELLEGWDDPDDTWSYPDIIEPSRIKLVG